MLYDINVLNRLSHHLCEAIDEQSRRDAENTLTKIVESNDCLQNCLLLLEQGDQPYGSVVASSALKRLLKKKISLNISNRLDLSRYLLKYLVERVSNMPKFVSNTLSEIFALLTKVGWFERNTQTEEYPFQAPIRQLLTLAKNLTIEGYLAMKLLTVLVEEVNSSEGFDTISKQRKISNDLREKYLLDFFILSIDVLKQSIGVQSNETQLIYYSQALELALACINYDFIGSMNDDTIDENVNIQVPTKWKPVLIEREVPKFFFDLYLSLPTEMVEKNFQIIVQLASVRRILFDTNDRLKYLDQIVNGIKLVLKNPDKLQNQENFHQFCRIVSRVKFNYQVAELLKSPEFPSMLSLLTHFTIQSFQMSDVQNSIFYLISFWSRIAGSLSYSYVNTDSISIFIPQICSAFVQSRIHFVEVVARENREDLLDDIGFIKQIMEFFGILSRHNYKQSIQELTSLFDENMDILLRQNITDQEISFIARKRLIWIIIFMASSISGKSNNNNSSNEDGIYNGEVVARVWKLMRITDNLLEQQSSTQLSDPQLEFAYLYLMEAFHKTFFTENIHRENHVYEKLNQELGIKDDVSVTKLFTQKIITNLKFWAKDEKLLSATLSFLSNFSTTYTNVNRILKIEEIQLLFTNHLAFDFVSSSTDLKIMRNRTNYYSSLFRLLSFEIEDNPSIFEIFMQPLTENFKKLYDVFQNGNLSNINTEYIRLLIIGSCRDLRGIIISVKKKILFSLLLNWSMPEVFVVLHGAIQLFSDDADVTTPVLKLISEYSLNNLGRLTYDIYSCASVVLFREVSKIICEYGNRILNLPDVPPEQYYKQRIKNIGVIFYTLRCVFSGNYLPFGVFWIYGDNCLKDALDVAFKLFIKIQDKDFLPYTKFAQHFYHLLDNVTRDNMCYVSKMDQNYFIAILKAINRGILSVDKTILSLSCTILDQILDFLFQRLSNTNVKQKSYLKEPDGNNCLIAIEKNPSLLAQLMTSILNQFMLEDVKCQWSMSRPLLGLIIANKEFFTQWKNDFIMGQPSSTHSALEHSFTKLMEGIKDNVSTKNKDNFIQNLCTFCKEVEFAIKNTSNFYNSDSNIADNHYVID